MLEAFVLVNSELRAEDRAFAEITSMDGVSGGDQTFGAYDAVARVGVEDADGLHDVVSKMRKVDGVISLLVLTVWVNK